MPNSNEIQKLVDIKAWLITLTAWQDWVGSVDETELNATIAWPLFAAPDAYPLIVPELASVRYRNITGAAAGSNFQGFGTLRLLVWDIDTDKADPTASFNTFANNFFGLLNEIVDKAHQSTLLFDAATTEEVPIVHSSQNEEYEGDVQVWHGVINLLWGVPAG